MNVEVLYITPNREEHRILLTLADGATVAEALQQSGIHSNHPETLGMSVGVFSKIVNLQTVLKEGDRVEIYRPLTIDPKEKRRLRVKKS